MTTEREHYEAVARGWLSERLHEATKTVPRDEVTMTNPLPSLADLLQREHASLTARAEAAEAHAGMMTAALVKCRNLTRMQEQSLDTVREVGEMVGKIVDDAIASTAAKAATEARWKLVADAERREKELKIRIHDLANEVQGLRGRLEQVREAVEGLK